MIWMVPALFYAAVVFLLDFLVRRKRWKENTKQQKTSLILTLVFAFPFVFLSFLGLFMGIEGTSSTNPVAVFLNKAAITGGLAIWAVCLGATIASVILRKKGKDKASITVQVAAFIYCMLVLVVYMFV